MKLYKKSERKMNIYDFKKAMKAGGFEAKSIGEYRKWKELHDGRVSVRMTIYEISRGGVAEGYVLADVLDRVACQIILNKQEVLDWIKEHGYKTDKQFYMEDMGMSEELWNEWNK
jgi:hypothetical protein